VVGLPGHTVVSEPLRNERILSASCCIAACSWEEPERRGPIESVRVSSSFHAHSLFIAAARICSSTGVLGSWVPGPGASAATATATSDVKVAATGQNNRCFIRMRNWPSNSERETTAARCIRSVVIASTVV
jgi:hypothetical protein